MSLSEADFQKQVTDLAERYHWQWLHIPTTQAVSRDDGSKFFRTIASGPLAKGWPDLVLIREKDRRLIFAELKKDGGKTSPEQDEVLSLLRVARWCPSLIQFEPDCPTIEVVIWRPADWTAVEAALR